MFGSESHEIVRFGYQAKPAGWTARDRRICSRESFDPNQRETTKSTGSAPVICWSSADVIGKQASGAPAAA